APRAGRAGRRPPWRSRDAAAWASLPLLVGRGLVGRAVVGRGFAGRGRLGRGLLAGEDLADLVLGPALAGDALKLVGDRLADLLVPGQRLLDRAGLPQRVGEDARVEDRRVRALALVVQHRVGRVADERHAARVPGVDRFDVVDGAAVDGVHVEAAGDVHDPLVEALDGLQQVVLGDLRRPGGVRAQGGDVEGDLAA